MFQYGIPAEEIAFIHDAKTDAQRDALFKEMRTGKKKVLIGSTDKCGTCLLYTSQDEKLFNNSN